MRGALAACFIIAAGVCKAPLAHEDVFDGQSDAGWTTAERKAGHDQALAMTRIHQLVTINDGLGELARRNTSACRWMNQVTGPETLEKQVTAFDANPAIKQVIQAARMTIREYLLTLHAVSETAISVHAAEHGMQLTSVASAGNVAFYREHRSEIERLLDAPDPC